MLITMGLGCRGLSEQEQQAIQPVVLDYWTVFDDVEQLRALAAQYSAARPYVTINVRQVRYEEFEKLFINSLADDVAPDIVSMHVHWLSKYQNRLAPMPASVQVANVYVKGNYAKETIVEQQTIAMPSLSVVKKNFIGAVAEDVVRNNIIYGLPIAIDTMAVYYNKDLLDKAGIAEPPVTWDEFLNAVKATTQFSSTGAILQSGTSLGTGENIDNAPDLVTLLMMQNGVEILKNGRVTFSSGLEKPTIDHPAMEAMRFYTDFARPNKEAYSWDDDKGNALDAFVRGNTVFYFGYSFDFDRIKSQAPQMNVEVISMFQLNPNVPVNVANYWIESVVKKSEHPNEAWDFIRFITTEQSIKQYTNAVGQPSPLRVHISEQSQNEVLKPFVSQILQAKNWYQGKDIDVASQALRDLITAYKEPYTEKDKPLQRDASLIVNAARIIQQTL